MNDFNPYAAPESAMSSQYLATEADEGRGVWQDEKTLVMAKAARLPSRCVKCNVPANYRLKRNLSWHNPALYFLIFFPGLLIYVIVALIVRHTAKIQVPLCEEHRSKRSKAILTGWLVALAGIALFFAPAVSEQLIPLVFVGIAMLLFGLIYGMIRSQVVTPQKIDKTHVWLNKVGPLYLASLPKLPVGDDAGEGKPPFDDEI